MVAIFVITECIIFFGISYTFLIGSPARSITPEDDDDENFSNCEKDFGDDLIMEWARVSKFSFVYAHTLILIYMMFWL